MMILKSMETTKYLNDDSIFLNFRSDSPPALYENVPQVSNSLLVEIIGTAIFSVSE